ncbi:MAG: DUF2950 domain-containing protein [Acetobacteraceae bacterium]
MSRQLLAAPLALALAIVPAARFPSSPAHAAAAEAESAATFASPEAAVAAFIEALKQDNTDRLRQILGPGSDPLITSGDPVADHEQRVRFLASYDQKHGLSADGADRMTLIVGDNDYPLPIPIVQVSGRWHFDSATGAQELVDRRIGRNEIAAIRVALAYHDAQKLYFDMTKQAGAGEYAQRIASSPGRHDGLYWPAADSEAQSPLAPLVDQAREEGYPDERVNGKPIPYQGYYFRILKSQGWAAPGGKQNYVANGRMTKGFALVAWPARYGASGVMTFIVNADGVVFQKDLGPRTDKLVAEMQEYNPDLTWTRVDVTP